MMPFLYTWRAAVASEHGPPNATTRHVLLTLSLHMDQDGGSCFPSITTLMAETSLSKKPVVNHLARAEEEGWISRDLRGLEGRKWRRYEYQATLPSHVEVVDEVHHVSPEGGGRGTPPQPKGGVPGANKVVDEVHPSSSIEDSNNNSGAVREVFDHWQNVSGHTKTRYTENRKRTIRARLRGFTVEELKTAISNGCADPFYQGDNDRGKRYDWIRTLLKNDEAVEKHLANGRKQEPEAGHTGQVTREELWAEIEGDE